MELSTFGKNEKTISKLTIKFMNVGGICEGM